MRLTTCFCLTVLLCAGPAASAAKAAGEQPIGVIVTSQNGRLDGTSAVEGSNFYGGEEFVTYESGAMQLRVRQCRIDLGATTDARFLPDSHPEHLLVIQGSARYSCPAGAAVWLETPAGVVRGADGMPASGLVVVNDAHSMTVSAYGEPLVLDNDGELHTINAGESYRVAISDDDAGAPPQAVQNKHRRRKLVFWLIGGSAAAFAVGEIWEQYSESPYKPTSSH
ncbi:MAG TPA: hypothetical protein VNU84_08220 [Candidatus Acidoferrum sp.]|jgi:hypothetical protein|nr:hypothetical protein [Candidatus Acidoferrum sp.]